MNPQSKLLFLIGILAFTATCPGQQPSDKKPLAHFATDIIKVDSILSAASHVNKQKILNNSPHFEKCRGSNASYKLNKVKDEWKECSVCPLISEIIWSNEKDE
ncbi:MAG TPA: hypothetical protein VFI33_04020 [Puia sp.]|nr:hypothetical protein [Puia sp.]